MNVASAMHKIQKKDVLMSDESIGTKHRANSKNTAANGSQFLITMTHGMKNRWVASLLARDPYESDEPYGTQASRPIQLGLLKKKLD